MKKPVLSIDHDPADCPQYTLTSLPIYSVDAVKLHEYNFPSGKWRDDAELVKTYTKRIAIRDMKLPREEGEDFGAVIASLVHDHPDWDDGVDSPGTKMMVFDEKTARLLYEGLKRYYEAPIDRR